MELYEFMRMPFGLAGAPSSFQCLVDKILGGLSFVTIHLNDILVHSKNEEMHRYHLRDVFERLAKARLTLKGKKCHLKLAKVQYWDMCFQEKA